MYDLAIKADDQTATKGKDKGTRFKKRVNKIVAQSVDLGIAENSDEAR